MNDDGVGGENLLYLHLPSATLTLIDTFFTVSLFQTLLYLLLSAYSLCSSGVNIL